MNSVTAVHNSICTGCGLCAAECPKKAIVMVADDEGFLRPHMDDSACVQCGLCLKDCPAVAEVAFRDDSRYYACIAADEELLLHSSSGGVFGLLANHVLEKGGYVCGCVYDEAMHPVHILSNRYEDVRRMCGSKYVQSICYTTFSAIKQALDTNAPVLFTGTACQVTALQTYLKRDYDNLYTAEILCHGVPSPTLLEKYVAYLEKKLHGKVTDIQFRNKERDGWGSEHRTCVVYRDKQGRTRTHRPLLPAYFSAFFYGVNLRPSCYTCRFARPERIADMTLGDYWGSWRKYGKRFHEGISVIAVNSPKGERLAEVVAQGCRFCDPLTREEASWSNDNLEHPIPCPAERRRFYRKLPTYRGLWKKAYLTKTYRKKTLQSFYGALVPARIRFGLHKLRHKR